MCSVGALPTRGAATAAMIGKARGNCDASNDRWSPRRRARELQRLPSLRFGRGPEDAEPATSPPVPELYDRSFSPRGGIIRRSAGALSTTPSRAAAQLSRRAERIAATGLPPHLRAIDATHTRWATPTTASSSARTCYLQPALHIMRTARRKRTPPATCHPDTLHREARRSCSTSTRSL